MTKGDKLQYLLNAHATLSARREYSSCTIKALDDLEDGILELCIEIKDEEATTEETTDTETETETNEE